MNVQSQFADLDTPTGVMRTYIHRPVGEGSYPTILFYSEIFQQTGPIERAAKHMASHGYVVMVPEVFHELQGYDSDNIALIKYAKQQDWCNGNIGAMGYCIGGHLAFRAALQPEVKATACFYATDLHIQVIPNAPGQHSMERLDDIKGELLMIWGKQDNHIPAAGLAKIHQALGETDISFTWHEFNAGHAFMRDEGDGGRYDAQTAQLGYQLALNLFSRKLR